MRYILLLLGLGFLYIAFIEYRNTREFLGHAEKTEGVVTELIPCERNSSSRSRQRNGCLPNPKVTFIAKNNQEYNFISDRNARVNNEYFELGDSVEVLYLPESPGFAIINNFTSIWLFFIFQFTIAVACIILSIILFIRVIWNERY